MNDVAREAALAAARAFEALATAIPPEPDADLRIEEPPALNEAPLSLEGVRHKLAALSEAGRAAEVKEALQTLGVRRLTDVKPGDYATLLETLGVAA